MIRIAFTLCIILLTACSSKPDYTDPPEYSYNYYSGGNKYGNHYCKVQSFTHIESGKTVTLIGMIHTADQSFFQRVDEILDEHDIVLEEGIHGLQSFGIHKYFSKYIFYTIKRFNYLQELSAQGHTLKNRDNTALADMSSDEFASEGSFYTPIIQLVSLPIMIVFTEPYYLLEKSHKTVLSIFSQEAAREKTAEIRHLSLSNMDLADKPSETFLPGIIDTRNKILLEKLEEQISNEKINSIAIPWGASHLPSLETELLKNGYSKVGNHKWLQTIAVEDLVENKDLKTQSSEFFGIPYLAEIEVTPKVDSASYLFSSINITESNDYKRFTLIYGELFENIKINDGIYFSVLPRVFGKPLFFDYMDNTKKDQYRLRLLWFFTFGELGKDGKN